MHLDFRLSFHPKYVTPVPSAHDHAKTEKAKKEKAKTKRKEKERKELKKQEKMRLKQKRKEVQNVPPGILISPVVTKEDHHQYLRNENTMTLTENTTHVHSMDDKPNLENGGVVIASINDPDIGRTELVPNQPEGFTNDTVLDSNDSEDSSDDELGERVLPSHTSGNMSMIYKTHKSHLNICKYRYFIHHNC